MVFFKKAAVALAALAYSVSAVALTEREVVQQHCTGTIEYRLPDQTRVDCLTDSVAWEYDWANKWYEAVAQALHYAMWTGREGGVVLIVRTQKDARYIERARRLIRHYRLPVIVVSLEATTN